jgi:hypothetical protein
LAARSETGYFKLSILPYVSHILYVLVENVGQEDADNRNVGVRDEEGCNVDAMCEDGVVRAKGPSRQR